MHSYALRVVLTISYKLYKIERAVGISRPSRTMYSQRG